MKILAKLNSTFLENLFILKLSEEKAKNAH